MKRIWLYLAFSFGLAWAVWIGGYLLSIPTTTIIGASSVVMWFPALATALSKGLTKEEKLIYATFKPLLKKNWRIYLTAWFLPALLAALGALIYFLCFPQFYDGHLTALTEAMGSIDMNPKTLVIIQILSAMIFAPLINMFFALGEEIGWRGLLFPTLKKRFGFIKAHLATGIIWGFWHTPINMLGYNYGLDYPGYPFGGIIAMCLFCTALGILLSLWVERSGTIWPAALGHGAVNAVASLPSLFLLPGEGYLQLLGPALNGFVAGIPLVLVALVTLLYYRNKERNRLTLVPPPSDDSH